MINLKFYFNILLLFLSSFEEFEFFEAKHAIYKIVGENFNLDVEITDIAVVKSSSGLDFVFCVRKLILQFEEVLIGFQIRIAFG